MLCSCENSHTPICNAKAQCKSNQNEFNASKSMKGPKQTAEQFENRLCMSTMRLRSHFLNVRFVLYYWNRAQLWWEELWLRDSLYCCKCCWLPITTWSQPRVPHSAHSFEQCSELWQTPQERKEGCRGHILGDSPHLRLQSAQQLDPVSLWGHGLALPWFAFEI